VCDKKQIEHVTPKDKSIMYGKAVSSVRESSKENNISTSKRISVKQSAAML
jgi:hypothetical protein